METCKTPAGVRFRQFGSSCVDHDMRGLSARISKRMLHRAVRRSRVEAFELRGQAVDQRIGLANRPKAVIFLERTHSPAL